MDWGIQWTFLTASLAVFFYWIRYPPFQNWLLQYFCAASLALPLSVILVEMGYFSFPVRFFPEYFDTSLLYEYFVLPLIAVRYYQKTLGRLMKL